ncbi:MAG: hypothetical protein FJ077_16550 [Cyanobacteria bacterium K_DeepCast_35m_m2_023]|nr:hypothetical protein [Cyanobacteria bacterium K_DeepCast_35m_m2_023]
MGGVQRRAAAEAEADVAGVRKKLLQLSWVQKAIKLTSPREKTKTKQAERFPRPTEWKRSTGIGGRLPWMATEAAADVAHGWHIFLLWVCILYVTKYVEFFVFLRKYPVAFFVTAH